MKISDRQASLFDVSAYESPPDSKYLWEDGDNQKLGANQVSGLGTKISSVPNDEFDKLGIKISSVPNLPASELGTKNIPVPNSPSSELGTKNIPVPNLPASELGTKISSVPNSDFDELGTGKTQRHRSEIWKPPVGLLVQTWVKTDWYWYWKYYDNRRKKRSIYLGKKYNKAVAKAQSIGMPANAKPPKASHTP